MTPKPGPVARRVAANVAAELARAGHDWTWLAGQVGVHESKAWRWRRGETAIGLDDLRSIATALGVDEELLRRE